MLMAMTSKERVRAAFSNNQPDRVPINYSANPGIDGRLKDHFVWSKTTTKACEWYWAWISAAWARGTRGHVSTKIFLNAA